MGIDAARGFALLGILMVNAAFFSLPFGEIAEYSETNFEGVLNRVVYWFTSVFCTSKFYPIFSILFGAGMAIMFDSASRSGQSSDWIFLRRLVVLGLFGIAHITLLWMGDILLLYAIIGSSMLVLGRASPRTLLVVAGVSFTIGIFTTLGFAAISSLGTSIDSYDEYEVTGAEFVEAEEEEEEAEPPPTPKMPQTENRILQVAKIFMTWNIEESYDSRLIQVEQEIQTQGPFIDTVFLRWFLYLFSLVYYIAVTAWVILSCFCLGAALAKTRFFDDPNSPWRKRFILLGLLLGLPISIVAAIAFEDVSTFGSTAVAFLGVNVGGPMLGLAYLSGILVWVERQPNNLVLRSLANLGRMGLTGYLLESLLMSAIMSYWGLGWFGSTTWLQRAGIVFVVFGLVLLVANLWMRFFRCGPIEWLWRSITYWNLQPLARDVRSE